MTETALTPAEARAGAAARGTISGRTLARGTSWLWGGNIVGQAAWFGSLIALGALLPPKAFGAVAIGIVIATAAALVQDAGSRGTIVLKRALTAGDIVRVVSLNVAIGIAITIAGVALAEPIVEHVNPGGDVLVLQVLMLSIAIRALAIAPMAILQRSLNFKLQASAQATSLLVAATAAIVAALAGAGVWALVVRQLAAALLLPLLAWIVAVRPMRAEFAAPPRERGLTRRRGGVWFFVLAATSFVALSADTVVVGHSRGAVQLGLYSLAFTLAFAPLTNFAWQIGKVVFPATAQTTDLNLIVERMLRITRLTATALLPLLPPTLLLAPVLLPGILGDDWKPMVVPFQILVCVGVGHAIFVALGDSLSGIGVIRWRALVEGGWALAMTAALIVLVHADGITGAALAHLLVFFPYAFIWLRFGTRRLQTSAGAMFGALREIVLAAIAQALVTYGCFTLLERMSVPPLAAASAAAAAGLVALVVFVARFTPTLAGECRAFTVALAGRRAT
jgi:O-antigen/teichoic acid export membrane protein